MHRGAVRYPVLISSNPVEPLRVFVKAFDSVPGASSIFGSKETLGRRACIPDVRFGGMTGCQPEDVVDDQRLAATARFLERRWSLGLLPGSARVRGSKHRRAEVACTRCGKHRLSVPRVENDVIDDVPQKHRFRHLPTATRSVALQEECSLTCSDQQSRAVVPDPASDGSCSPGFHFTTPLHSSCRSRRPCERDPGFHRPRSLPPEPA